MDNRIKTIKEIKGRFWMNETNYLHPNDGSLKYWKYRVLRPLLKLKYKSYRKRIKSAPWLSPSSIEFFIGYLNKEMVGAEFGSGASTVFFAERIKHLVSIEHNDEWYELVHKRLQMEGLENVDYRLIRKQSGEFDQSIPEALNKVQNIEQFGFRKEYFNYFTSLQDFPDVHFDFIIVDGRARPECVFASIPKLKRNGLMILDNSERKRYEIVFEELKDWECVNTTNGLTDTTFWIKP